LAQLVSHDLPGDVVMLRHATLQNCRLVFTQRMEHATQTLKVKHHGRSGDMPQHYPSLHYRVNST
jgi:hypothetical protein